MEFPILAIDYGKKHIGLAVSDNKGILCTPLSTLNITKNRDINSIIEEIKGVCEEYNVKSLLFGIPQSFTDSQKESEGNVEQFISKVLSMIDLPHQKYDESFSTSDAQNMLLSTGQNIKGSRYKIDSVAAATFLQQYLDNININR